MFCFQLACARDFVIQNIAMLRRHISELVPQVLHRKSLQCTRQAVVTGTVQYSLFNSVGFGNSLKKTFNAFDTRRSDVFKITPLHNEIKLKQFKSLSEQPVAALGQRRLRGLSL